MDGRPDACSHCGAPLAPGGRFCSRCGSPVSPVTLTPAPSTDTASTDDPYESLYAAPVVPPAAPGPPAAPVGSGGPGASGMLPAAFAGTEPVPPAAPLAEPLPAEPVATPRSPGPGLWVGAAALLLTVLVLGSFLLLHGSGGSPSSSSTPPIAPEPSPTSSSEVSSPARSPTTSAPASSAPAGPASEVAGLAQASAPAHAPAAVDFTGRPVTYVAANMVDGRADTCWRVAGDATGTVLTFRLAQPTRLTEVGLINGYDKIAYAHGRTYDWYTGNRRILSVEWLFDDGTTVTQQLGSSRRMQRLAIDPVSTRVVKLRITSVSPPGRGPAARNDTAVSEVSLRGTAG